MEYDIRFNNSSKQCLHPFFAIGCKYIPITDEVYNNAIGSDYRTIVKIMPCTDISFLAIWKDGRLCKTAQDDPFVYECKKLQNAGVLLDNYVNDALESLLSVLKCLLFAVVIFMAEIGGLCFTRTKEEYDSNVSEFNYLTESIHQINLLRYAIFAATSVVGFIIVLLYNYFIMNDNLSSNFGGLDIITLLTSNIVGLIFASILMRILSGKLCRHYKDTIIHSIIAHRLSLHTHYNLVLP